MQRATPTPFPWTLKTGSTVLVVFGVLGDPVFDRPEEGRVAQDPCGGSPTLLSTTATLPLRRFRARVRLDPGSSRDSNVTALRSAWAGRGPYTLVTPFGTMTVVCDPSQGPFEETMAGDGGREFLVGFQER